MYLSPFSFVFPKGRRKYVTRSRRPHPCFNIGLAAAAGLPAVQLADLHLRVSFDDVVIIGPVSVDLGHFALKSMGRLKSSLS